MIKLGTQKFETQYVGCQRLSRDSERHPMQGTAKVSESAEGDELDDQDKCQMLGIRT
jgi:hypothetical protein